MGGSRKINHFVLLTFIAFYAKASLWNGLCQCTETTVTCYNFDIKPPWKSFQLINFTSSYEIISFEECSIEFMGKDFYDLFASAVELRFSNCNISFASEKKKVLEDPSQSKITKLYFKDSTLERNDFGYGFSSLVDLESLHIYNSALHFNELQVSYDVRLKFKELRIVESGLKYLSEMDKLINLEVLDLTGNPLRSTKPRPTLQLNQRLTHLSIESTSIGRLSNLPTSLEYLNIRNSSWNVITEDDFQFLLNLKHLDVSANHIVFDEKNLGAFDDLMALEYLNVSNNTFVDLSSRIFAGVSNVKELCISNANIDFLSKETFANLRKLEIVDLSNNNLKVFNKSVLLGLDDLKVLNLRGNDIENLKKQSFEGLKELTVEFDNWWVKKRSIWEKLCMFCYTF